MGINKINLGDGKFAIEFVLQPKTSELLDRSFNPKPAVDKRVLSYDDFSKLYYNQELMKAGNKTLPYILICEFNYDELSNHKMVVSTKEFETNEKFRKFREGVLKAKLNKNSKDNKKIGFRDYKIEDGSVSGVVNKVGYFDFMATNMSIDAYIEQFDSSFGKNETLRNYEIDKGRAILPCRSNLSNMLGLGYMIRLPDDGNSILYGVRSSGMAVAGGALSMIGGTPSWKKGWQENGEIIYMKDIITEDAAKQFSDELCLEPHEYKIIGGFFANELERAPTYFSDIEVYVPAEEIAKRAIKSDSARNEHSSFVKVPLAATNAVDVLKSNGFNIYSSTELCHDRMIKKYT